MEEAPTTIGVKNMVEIFGISGILLVKITGYLAITAFILNFVTCFAMPWSKDKCPWKGCRPGADHNDKEGHYSLYHYHHYFTWLTIVLVILHFVLAKLV